MEYVPDISTVWPEFAARPIEGLATVHYSDRDLGGDAWDVLPRLEDAGLPRARYLALFLSRCDDSPLNRALTFWKRFPDLARGADHWAARRIENGTIEEIALLDVGDAGDVRRTRRGIADRLRHQWFVLCPVVLALDADADVQRLLNALGATPRRWMPESEDDGLRRWVLRSGQHLGLGLLLLRQEEDGEHRMGMGLYSTRERIDLIRAGLTEVGPSGPPSIGTGE